MLEAHSAVAGRRYLLRTKENAGEESSAIVLRPGRNQVELPRLDRAMVIEPHAMPRAPRLQPGEEWRP